MAASENVVMDLIGDTLRRARVRQGLKLEQVAAKTKIGSRFLHAMEQNRFEVLPGGLSTRSFSPAVHASTRPERG